MLRSSPVQQHDPLARFEHDHAHLARQVGLLRGDLATAQSSGTLAPDFVPVLVALTEELVEHFAREEEGLFPFIESNVPDLAPAVAELVAAHDRMCGVASRLIAAERRDPSSTSIEHAVALFHRFEAVYVDHAAHEREFLRTVAARLDSGKREQLAELLRGI